MYSCYIEKLGMGLGNEAKLLGLHLEGGGVQGCPLPPVVDFPSLIIIISKVCIENTTKYWNMSDSPLLKN